MSSTNYLINRDEIFYKNIMKKNVDINLEYFIANPINNIDINIIINTSVNSNGIINFIKEIYKNKNKNIKIYLYKQDGIIDDFISVNLSENNIQKLINILGYIKLAYYTGYKKQIEDFITNNNINNYLIYY